MTIHEAISRIDSLYPNTYSSDVKISYLSKLDGNIKKNIIDKYEGGKDVTFSGYKKASLDTELLVGEPYTDMYVFWLQAWIDYWNGEYDKYNTAIAMYEALYNAFEADYHNTHTPIKTNLKFW